MDIRDKAYIIMRRLYVTLPNIDQCRTVVDRLTANGISVHQLHVVGARKKELADLPHANEMDLGQISHSLRNGLLLGALAGAIGAWLVIHMPPPGLVLAEGWTPYVLLTAIGALAGAIMSAATARGVPHHQLRDLKRALAQGQLVLVVDIRRERVGQASEILYRLDPQSGVSVSRLPRY